MPVLGGCVEGECMCEGAVWRESVPVLGGCVEGECMCEGGYVSVPV